VPAYLAESAQVNSACVAIVVKFQVPQGVLFFRLALSRQACCLLEGFCLSR